MLVASFAGRVRGSRLLALVLARLPALGAPHSFVQPRARSHRTERAKSLSEHSFCNTTSFLHRHELRASRIVMRYVQLSEQQPPRGAAGTIGGRTAGSDAPPRIRGAGRVSGLRRAAVSFIVQGR